MQSNFELPQARDVRIDLFRGFALLAIFIDHVPNNVFVLLTPHAFAFADAGELFFFLSGFVSALVYGRTLRTSGFLATAMRTWRRAWTLYIAQIMLLLLLIAEVSLGVIRTGDFFFHTFFRSEDFLLQPDRATLHALLLGFQPVYLDIIPCYVIFLLVFPFVLLALARNVWLALVPSFALYLFVQVLGWNFVTFPRREGWFFDPLAWQFLFVLGATFGSGGLKPVVQFLSKRWAVLAAAAITLVIAAIQLTQTLHIVWPDIPALLSSAPRTTKGTLAPLRLVSFFALVVLAHGLIAPDARFLRTRFARSVACCGRHSLTIFCLGVLLAIGAFMLLKQLGQSPLSEVAVAAAGIAILIAAGRALDWIGHAVGKSKTVAAAEPALASPRPFSNRRAVR